jgi:hypothetical protein
MLPREVLVAAGVTDPFGNQLQLFKLLYHIIDKHCLSRLKYFGVEPDFSEIAERVRCARQSASFSFTGYLVVVLKEYTAKKIEAARQPTEDYGTLQEAFTELQDRLCAGRQ